MKKYNYIAINKKGEKITGDTEAKSDEEVAGILIESGLSPVKITEKVELLAVLDNSLNAKGVALKEKVVFLREFSTMISAGLAIDDALEVSIAQTSNKTFKKVLTEITKDVRSGSSLATSLQKYPKVFQNIEVSLIKAGEVSGKLDTILLRLADDVEKQEELKGRVRGALSYPIFVLVIAGVVVGLITIRLVPAMQALYSGFGANTLPLPTEILVAISNALTNYYIFIILFAVILFIMYKYYVSRPEGRLVVDKFSLSFPVLGDLLLKFQLVMFIKTYAMLLASGIPVINALNLVSDALSNSLFSTSIKEVSKDVEKGVSLAAALQKHTFIPSILWRSIAVGEETGKTEDILNKIGVYYENDVNNKVNNLTRLLEPILLVVLGSIVGFIAVAIYLPIYNFSSVVH